MCHFKEVRKTKKYQFTQKDKTGSVKDCGYMIYDSADDESAELRFYGDICSASWISKYFEEDKAPQDVADFLAELTAEGNGHKKLNVYVNSGGGDVFGGLAIYSILARYPGEKIAHIDGIAASIAGIIPFACDKVIAPKYAQLMLHKPWSGCWGNANDFKKTIEALNTAEQSIVNVYKAHAVNGTTEDKIKSMIDRETWLTAEQAAEYFDIELLDTEPVAACVSDSYQKYTNTPEALLNISQSTKQTETPAPQEDEVDNRKRKLQMSLDVLKLSNKS